MKTTKLLTVVFILALAATARAQEFTIALTGGYAGPGLLNTESVLGPDIDPSQASVDQLANMANINDSAHIYKQIHGSYGTGANVALAVGYMFNNYIGFNIGVGYQHSANIGCTDVRALPAPATGYYLTADISSYSYAVALAPSLIINGQKPGWKVYPYARVGIALPVAGKLVDNVAISLPGTLNSNTSPDWLGNRTQVQMQTSAILSLGITGAVGVAYRPIPLIGVFAELNGQYLNVSAKSSTITEWTAYVLNPNGTTTAVNDIPARGVYRTQFNYVNQLSATSNNAQYNPNWTASNPQYSQEPKQDTRPVVPGSNFGFNVGITFYLSKKTLKKDAASAKK